MMRGLLIDDYQYIRRIGNGGGVHRGHHPPVAGPGTDLDARSSALGIDAQRSLRRCARDRPEHAGDERGGGRGHVGRRPRWDELRFARSRRRLARGNRACEPDDNRVTASPRRGSSFPEQLYEFFADEVYRGLQPDVRIGLGLLATAPSLDRELAVELLGPERAERVCAEALTLGVLEERGGKLELHPLAAAFLEERAKREATRGY